MKDLYVKIGSKGKDWCEVEVFLKLPQAKHSLAFRMVTIRYSNLNGIMTSQEIGEARLGFLCSECKTTVFSDTHDGHCEYDEGHGLCAMCASTEAIFNKWFGYKDLDKEGNEYVWKGK
jgi:hypothetical protein